MWDADGRLDVGRIDTTTQVERYFQELSPWWIVAGAWLGARSVLHIFERERPDDRRARRVLHLVKAYLRGAGFPPDDRSEAFTYDDKRLPEDYALEATSRLYRCARVAATYAGADAVSRYAASDAASTVLTAAFATGPHYDTDGPDEFMHFRYSLAPPGDERSRACWSECCKFISRLERWRAGRTQPPLRAERLAHRLPPAERITELASAAQWAQHRALTEDPFVAWMWLRTLFAGDRLLSEVLASGSGESLLVAWDAAVERGLAQTSRIHAKITRIIDPPTAVAYLETLPSWWQISAAWVCARSVLQVWEREHPGDERPRNACDACRDWLREASSGDETASTGARAGDASDTGIGAEAAAEDADEAASCGSLAAASAAKAAAFAAKAVTGVATSTFAALALDAADVAIHGSGGVDRHHHMHRMLQRVATWREVCVGVARLRTADDRERWKALDTPAGRLWLWQESGPRGREAIRAGFLDRAWEEWKRGRGC